MEIRNKWMGFTLIELMITIVIVGILSGIAVAVYQTQVLKGRRADAINTLLAISLAEERYRSNNSSYSALAAVWPTTTTSQGYYTLATSNVTATSYTITATGTGTQANDAENGTACSSLVLAVSSGTVTKTPSVCWPS